MRGWGAWKTAWYSARCALSDASTRPSLRGGKQGPREGTRSGGRGRIWMRAPPAHPTQEPVISLILKVNNPDRRRLERAIQSFRAQSYSRGELIAVVDAGAPEWARELLSGVPQAEDKGAARKLASGEWVGRLGEDDFLSPAALEHFAAAADNSAELLYSDEDVVDASGAPLRPVFKPDWSPLLLRSTAYTGGLCLKRAGWNGEPRNAIHIPRVLYHAFTQTLPNAARAANALSKTPLVTIIICTRTSKLLKRCLEGIGSRTDYPTREILVVQHTGSSSQEEERDVARAIELSGAKRTIFGERFNFSEMNNRGAREASGEILLFLNDDVEPLTPDWLTRLVGQLEDPVTGAAGAKLVYPGGAIQHAGIATWLIDGAGHPGRHLFGSENWPWLAFTREVTAVTGACLAIRRADFETLGGFDPIFPVNYNDVDLCLRLRAEGLRVVIDMNAILRHDESQTRRAGTNFDERRLFYRKWAKVVEKVDPYYSPHLAQNNENLSLRWFG